MRQLLFISLSTLSLSMASQAYAIRESTLTEPLFLDFSLGTGVKFETADYGTELDIDTWL